MYEILIIFVFRPKIHEKDNENMDFEKKGDIKRHSHAVVVRAHFFPLEAYPWL